MPIFWANIFRQACTGCVHFCCYERGKRTHMDKSFKGCMVQEWFLPCSCFSYCTLLINICLLSNAYSNLGNKFCQFNFSWMH